MSALKKLSSQNSAEAFDTLYNLLGPNNLARELGVSPPSTITWKNKRLDEPSHFDPYREKLLALGQRALTHLESGEARKNPGDFWAKINMVKHGGKSKRSTYAEENKQLQEEVKRLDPNFDSVEGSILDWNQEFSSLDALSNFIGFNYNSIYRIVGQSDSAKDFFTISVELENVVLKKHLDEFKKSEALKDKYPKEFSNVDDFFLALEMSYSNGDSFWLGVDGRERSDLIAKDIKRIWPLKRLPKEKIELLISRYQSMSPEQKALIKSNLELAKKLQITNTQSKESKISENYEYLKKNGFMLRQASSLFKLVVKMANERALPKEKFAKLLSRPPEKLDTLLDAWKNHTSIIAPIDVIRLQAAVVYLNSLQLPETSNP